MVLRGRSSNCSRTGCGQRDVYLPFLIEKKRTTLNNVYAVHLGLCSALGEGVLLDALDVVHTVH